MVIKEFQLVEKPEKPVSMNPKKFMVWLFMVSITMLFAAFTSAYLVRQSDGNWLQYGVPQIFWKTTGLLLLSSITMQWAYISAKRDVIKNVRLAVGITGILGIMFLIGQVIGWGKLVESGVYLVGNPAGSFMYVLTGVHGLHLVSGIVFIMVVMWATLRYRVHSKNMLLIEMCSFTCLGA